VSKTHKKKSKPIICRVASDKMEKSRVGTVDRTIKLGDYKKYIRRTSKLMFHDEKNETKVGDKVLIEPSKPYSSRKRFILVKILESARI